MIMSPLQRRLLTADLHDCALPLGLLMDCPTLTSHQVQVCPRLLLYMLTEMSCADFQQAPALMYAN